MSLNTPFDNAVVPNPSGSFADTTGMAPPDPVGGGNPITTPYDNGLVKPRTDLEETPNSLSGLPAQNRIYNVGEQEPTNAPDISTGQIPVAGLGKK